MNVSGMRDQNFLNKMLNDVELLFIQDVLQKNNYPKKFINNRIKKMEAKFNKIKETSTNQNSSNTNLTQNVNIIQALMNRPVEELPFTQTENEISSLEKETEDGWQ